MTAPASTPWMLSLIEHRDFRLLWLGQLIALSGTTMQTAAILWQLSTLVPADQKGLTLGAVGLVRVAPMAVISLLSGVAADTWDRRRLMIAAQAALALIAAALALLTFRGAADVWSIYLLTAASTAVGAVDVPARQALIPALVPREHLPNALSLHQIVLEAAYVGGPSLAGLVIASAGLGWVYALNAIASAGALLALAAMRGVRRDAGGNRPRLSWGALRDGLSFVFATPIVRSTMMLDFIASFFAAATVLLPMFAQEVLRIGAGGYGLLAAAPAMGSVAASVAMVRVLGRRTPGGAMLLWAIPVYGVAMIGFGLSRSFEMAFGCLAAAGAAYTVGAVLRRVIRQLETPDGLRGRMTGVNMLCFMGGPELGNAQAGLLAHWWGAPAAVISGGVATLAATAWMASAAPALRRYRQP